MSERATGQSAIYHGLTIYKVGEWNKIKQDPLFKQILAGRTNVQIKVMFVLFLILCLGVTIPSNCRPLNS